MTFIPSLKDTLDQVREEKETLEKQYLIERTGSPERPERVIPNIIDNYLTGDPERPEQEIDDYPEEDIPTGVDYSEEVQVEMEFPVEEDLPNEVDIPDSIESISEPVDEPLPNNIGIKVPRADASSIMFYYGSYVGAYGNVIPKNLIDAIAESQTIDKFKFLKFRVSDGSMEGYKFAYSITITDSVSRTPQGNIHTYLPYDMVEWVNSNEILIGRFMEFCSKYQLCNENPQWFVVSLVA